MANGAALRLPALTHFGVAGVIGVLGGLMGLGGAEFRLPYLVGILGFSARQAVPINLAISLATVLAALPARALSITAANLAPFAPEAASLAAGAVVAAFLGAGWLRRLSNRRLSLIILGLLVALGVALIAFTASVRNAGRRNRYTRRTCSARNVHADANPAAGDRGAGRTVITGVRE